jgi:hypothetical protein
MVNPARFERATSTSAESRSDSAELRVLGLAETEGVEPSQDYTRLFSKQLRLPFRHVSRKSLAEGEGLELSSAPVRSSFQDCALTS